MSTITKVNVGGVDYDLGGAGVGKMVEITHAELKALKDSSSLEAGTKYRITDYVGMFKTLKSANHPFDIVVEAMSESVLSEKASAMRHEGDDYFANAKMELWEVWYSLENDTTRFSEAAENGKGYIYKLKDEYMNDVCFDFKNALFTLASTEYPFITASSGSLDFYLFSHNKGTSDDFSNQSNIEDLSVIYPDSVYENYVNTSIIKCIVLGLDKSIMELIAKPTIYGNSITASEAVYIANSRIMSVDKLTVTSRLKVKGRPTISNCEFVDSVVVEGDGDLSNCKFFGFSSIEVKNQNVVSNEFISVPYSTSKLTINCELRGCIVRLIDSDSTTYFDLSQSTLGEAELYNKLIWGKVVEDTDPYEYEYKVLDPFTLAT